jgi:hypothetical protein
MFKYPSVTYLKATLKKPSWYFVTFISPCATFQENSNSNDQEFPHNTNSWLYLFFQIDYLRVQ